MRVSFVLLLPLLVYAASTDKVMCAIDRGTDEKCTNCLHHEQCREAYNNEWYCCPRVKKCMQIPTYNGGKPTGCSESANCDPKCYDRTWDGILRNCGHCTNSDFPNDWVTCKNYDWNDPNPPIEAPGKTDCPDRPEFWPAEKENEWEAACQCLPTIRKCKGISFSEDSPQPSVDCMFALLECVAKKLTVYQNKGAGQCLVKYVAQNEDNSYFYDDMSREKCESTCTDNSGCFGYSWSKYKSCYHWTDFPLTKGGKQWGECTCMAKKPLDLFLAKMVQPPDSGLASGSGDDSEESKGKGSGSGKGSGDSKQARDSCCECIGSELVNAQLGASYKSFAKMDWGAQCDAHDEKRVYCQDKEQRTEGSRDCWCPLEWCYVLPCCESSEPSKQFIGTDLYYSYRTCAEGGDKDDWKYAECYDTDVWGAEDTIKVSRDGVEGSVNHALDDVEGHLNKLQHELHTVHGDQVKTVKKVRKLEKKIETCAEKDSYDDMKQCLAEEE